MLHRSLAGVHLIRMNCHILLRARNEGTTEVVLCGWNLKIEISNGIENDRI
ncbi:MULTISPECIES: hypothetical protein [Paenibacillus]|uniref:hypothetical protein n=1 Tax=Paenibacillus TaxID=44249 RepID=UPI0004AF9873|nr:MULTISPECIES: hypothetical protein [Paenibacillus]